MSAAAAAVEREEEPGMGGGTDGEVRVVRDADGHAWEVGTVAAPAAWATALVDGDRSGLEADPEDAAACRAWVAAQAAEGRRAADAARDADGDPEDPWLSSAAALHGSPHPGADLLGDVRERRRAAG